jgi:hypothetical protein
VGTDAAPLPLFDAELLEQILFGHCRASCLAHAGLFRDSNPRIVRKRRHEALYGIPGLPFERDDVHQIKQFCAEIGGAYVS